MVVFDSTVMLLVLYPDAKAPLDPDTRQPIEKAKERIEYLIQKLVNNREKVIIPTPVLSEVLVYAGESMSEYVDMMSKNSAFSISPFDGKAAIEAAIAMHHAIKRGGIRADSADPDATKAKIKFDRQIVAIAKVQGAHTIYSDDKDVHKYGESADLKVMRTADLDLPPESVQGSLEL